MPFVCFFCFFCYFLALAICYKRASFHRHFDKIVLVKRKLVVQPLQYIQLDDTLTLQFLFWKLRTLFATSLCQNGNQQLCISKPFLAFFFARLSHLAQLFALVFSFCLTQFFYTFCQFSMAFSLFVVSSVCSLSDIFMYFVMFETDNILNKACNSMLYMQHDSKAMSSQQ